LHPKIHGGLLADMRKPEHVAQLSELGIEAFELVVVNLYPFAQTVASGASIEECIEQIDIGGPAMVRASAKNHANVAVVVDPASYASVLDAVKSDGFTRTQRVALATLAFQHVAQYDVAVSSWLASVVLPDADPSQVGFPAWFGGVWERAQTLRYGENPHQDAALYVAKFGNSGIAQAEQLHGKEMSYNNFVDADAAYRAAYDHKAPTVAIIKHANPCGIASDKDIAQAYQKANATDPVSAFGGVIATNQKVTKEMALAVSEIFTEVIVAPDFDKMHLMSLKKRQTSEFLK
jgi:phosphoribosylaminoimidazolecarboxamide formyltransferase / IMP cyclohydrolase